MSDILLVLGLFVLFITMMLGVWIAFAFAGYLIHQIGYWINIKQGNYIEVADKISFDDYQAEIMDRISDEEFEEIKSQLTEDNFYLGTLYLTEKYIFFPSESVLLPYSHIGYADIQHVRIKVLHRSHRVPRLALNCKGYGTKFFSIGDPNRSVHDTTMVEAFLLEFREILKNGSKKNEMKG